MKFSAKVLFIIISMSFFVGASLPAHADNHSKDRAFIQYAIRKMDAAGMKKDVDGCIAFVHPDYVQVNLAGHEIAHGKKELRQRIAKVFAHVTSIVAHTTITNITFSKEGATVTDITEGEFKMSVNGHERVIKNRSTFRAFWVKSGNRWLEKRSQVIPSNKVR
jgi:ketosteroid isomerase-like protein